MKFGRGLDVGKGADGMDWAVGAGDRVIEALELLHPIVINMPRRKTKSKNIEAVLLLTYLPPRSFPGVRT